MDESCVRVGFLLTGILLSNGRYRNLQLDRGYDSAGMRTMIADLCIEDSVIARRRKRGEPVRRVTFSPGAAMDGRAHQQLTGEPGPVAAQHRPPASLLEGTMPDRYNVSQLGFRADGKDYELDGLPLMTPGRTYVMALVAPSAREPQDALLVLSAMAGGNLVEVDGVPSLNPAVDRYRTAVARQRSPWAQADRMDEKRADDYRRWRPGA